MFKIRMINNVAKRDDVVSGDTVLSELIDKNSDILSGSTQFALNGDFLGVGDFDKTLTELGCSPAELNTLATIKPANGNC